MMKTVYRRIAGTTNAAAMLLYDVLKDEFNLPDLDELWSGDLSAYYELPYVDAIVFYEAIGERVLIERETEDNVLTQLPDCRILLTWEEVEWDDTHPIQPNTEYFILGEVQVGFSPQINNTGEYYEEVRRRALEAGVPLQEFEVDQVTGMTLSLFSYTETKVGLMS